MVLNREREGGRTEREEEKGRNREGEGENRGRETETEGRTGLNAVFRVQALCFFHVNESL